LDAELQFLKPQLLAQAFVRHKFVMDLPDGVWIDEKTGKTAPCRVMAVKAYSHEFTRSFRQLFNHPSTLEDLGITEERSKQIISATTDAWKDSLQNPFALACVL
jgi:hypothetical protein